MDPDATLLELNEWYNELQDGNIVNPAEALERVILAFDDLDSWLRGGGALPDVWSR